MMNLLEGALARLSRFLRRQEAPTMVEYGLLLALIALVAAAAIFLFGQAAVELFEVPPKYFG